MGFKFNLNYTLQNNIFLTLFVGQNLVKLQEVDSTNFYLKKLLSNSKPLIEGTVIMAENQTAGRGQSNNKWLSENGKNLTLSIYLKPSFLSVNEQFELNKAISLGVTDCLIPLLGDDCSVKWPNDIYFHDKKIGGILIENTTKGYQLKDSVVGIGLNVNQKSFGDLENRATSITKILHQDYDLENLLMQLCQSIESRYLQLKAGKKDLLDQDYEKKLFRLNENHFFEINQNLIQGIIRGVSPFGRLCLESNNKILELDLKEVKFKFED